MRSALLMAAIAGLSASSALAQAPGSVVFTVEFSNNATHPRDSIGLWQSGIGSSNLLDFTALPDADVRLADIKRGPNGDYYFTDGPVPVSPSPTNARVGRVSNLFTAPSVSNLTINNRLGNPIGLGYHGPSNSWIVANNPGGDQQIGDPLRQEGFVSVNNNTGVQTVSFTETDFPNIVRPEFSASAYLTRDPQGSNDFYAPGIEGGQFFNAVDGRPGSTLHRFSPNASGVSTEQFLVDLTNQAVTGLDHTITFATGITAVPGTNQLFITNRRGWANDGDSIYRILLNPDGTFQSISPILSGIIDPEAIAYDPFNNKLVFGGNGSLLRVNLDGTGLETLIPVVPGGTEFKIRGIEIVPAPGAAGLLAVAGLLIGRRRR